jgi:hypothetical protein
MAAHEQADPGDRLMPRSVTVTGVAELRADLGTLWDAVPAAYPELARAMADRISSFAPRRTGRLAGSWEPATDTTSASASSGVVYAGPINFGWRARNIRPASFVERAITAIEVDAAERIDQALDDQIRAKGLN